MVGRSLILHSQSNQSIISTKGKKKKYVYYQFNRVRRDNKKITLPPARHLLLCWTLSFRKLSDHSHPLLLKKKEKKKKKTNLCFCFVGIVFFSLLVSFARHVQFFFFLVQFFFNSFSLTSSWCSNRRNHFKNWSKVFNQTCFPPVSMTSP